jgi:hypothetical protein
MARAGRSAGNAVAREIGITLALGATCTSLPMHP